jgi:hypothetical protein
MEPDAVSADQHIRSTPAPHPRLCLEKGPSNGAERGRANSRTAQQPAKVLGRSVGVNVLISAKKEGFGSLLYKQALPRHLIPPTAEFVVQGGGEHVDAAIADSDCIGAE